MIADDLDDFTTRVAEHFQSALGLSLREVYKLGSLAHGGYSEIYSDIDVGLLLSCAAPPPAMADLSILKICREVPRISFVST